MKAIVQLRAAIVVELAEITKHYHGIIEHLDALAGLEEEKAFTELPTKVLNSRKKKGGPSIATQVRVVLQDLAVHDIFTTQNVIQWIRSNYKRGQNPSPGAVRQSLRALARKGFIRSDGLGRGHITSYTVLKLLPAEGE